MEVLLEFAGTLLIMAGLVLVLTDRGVRSWIGRRRYLNRRLNQTTRYPILFGGLVTLMPLGTNTPPAEAAVMAVMTGLLACEYLTTRNILWRVCEAAEESPGTPLSP